MAIVRWTDPFREFAHLQDRINRVFTDAYRDDEGFVSGAWTPPVDIYQNGDHEVVLKAELPDMTPDAIDITVDNGVLTIKGEKKVSDGIKEEQFHRIERRYGSFLRTLALPPTAKVDAIKASFDKGVLTVEVPKAEEAKPRRITIKAIEGVSA